MAYNFEYITNLEYKVKSLTAKLNNFKSGETYIVMYSEFKKQLKAKDREIKALKLQLGNAHNQTITNRKNWMIVTEDLAKEYSLALKQKDRKNSKLEKRALKAETQLIKTKDKLQEKRTELYKTLTELEEQKEKNKNWFFIKTTK